MLIVVFRKICILHYLVSSDCMPLWIAFVTNVEKNCNCEIENAFIGRMIYYSLILHKKWFKKDTPAYFLSIPRGVNYGWKWSRYIYHMDKKQHLNNCVKVFPYTFGSLIFLFLLMQFANKVLGTFWRIKNNLRDQPHIMHQHTFIKTIEVKTYIRFRSTCFKIKF